MDFKKKLKIRLYIALSYIVIGLLMIITFNIIKAENDFLSSFGFALIVIGIVRIREYRLITKDEASITRRKIAETDERNISIQNKAKSLSFMIYLFLACVSVIVLELLNKTSLASILSLSVGVLIVLYWIIYFIISKKS